MRVTHLRSLVLVAALAGTSLAMSGSMTSDPILSPDAEPSCWLARGADTATTDDDLEVCRQDVWFHDPGTKVGNAGAVTGEFASWDTNAPDTSVTGGAGGGALASSASHQLVEPWDERFSMVADGAFEGVFDTVAVELYLFPPAGMAQGESTFRVDAQLLVDGQPVASIGDLTVPMETAGNAVQRVQFAWTGLADAMEFWEVALDGTHDVRLTVHGTGFGSNAAAFVYDTTEVPAGMAFNIDPADLEGIPTVKS